MLAEERIQALTFMNKLIYAHGEVAKHSRQGNFIAITGNVNGEVQMYKGIEELAIASEIDLRMNKIDGRNCFYFFYNNVEFYQLGKTVEKAG